MSPTEYTMVRSLAGLYDDSGSGASRWSTPYVAEAIIAAFVLWIAPVSVVVVLRASELVAPLGLGSLLVLLPASLWFFRRRARRADLNRQAATSKRYAADLEARQIDESRLRVVNAVEVEEVEDEGMQFYLELEDGRVMFLMTQEFYHEEYDGRFPSTEVIVTRLPHSDELLTIDPVGDYLPVSEEWPAFTGDDYEHGRVPAHGALLPGPLSRYRPESESDTD